MINVVGEKWPSIEIEDVTLTYRVLRYSKCMLDCDTDLEKLVLLCNIMGVSRVDAQVNVMVSDDESDEYEDDENQVSSGCL